eukprot:CAMPEP_0179183020 /NCGR_PEP_ID=MMETSP0796-20121207/90692_1 /TAXON_ID=73915 /ORGANISM="Pyrodinium bahamense, Strain pbaha01" /LENGTH=101 /DNA_ID=CAMNT_0020886873 /DNA_START=27 /DNA_END=328 /DNA_ORIENTATION=-
MVDLAFVPALDEGVEVVALLGPRRAGRVVDDLVSLPLLAQAPDGPEGKTYQVIDDAPGSSWSEQSYDLYTFIKGRDEGESYAERSGAGQDQIMMLTMLEQL